MLSPKTQTNLANAQSYFQEHLCVGDYYTESERVRGEWLGIGAATLGLSGAVEQDHFIALCENRNPQTGERLTVRHNTTRRDGEREVANRRVFYDFTLSPPKSVSVAALVGGDERITVANAVAVRTAMQELERFAATQVHLGTDNRDRATGNVVAALFQHDTSRALVPHLHTHCIVFNATHDSHEQRWKALHIHAMLTAQKFVENVYYHEIAKQLGNCGYTVVNRARGDFELAEVPASVRDCFSKRHHEIDAKTAELLAAHPNKVGGNIADIREHIAHKDRGRKLPSLPREQLREFWRSQLPGDAVIDAARKPDIAASISVADAVDWAEEHLFERRSIVSEHEIWRHALLALARENGARVILSGDTRQHSPVEASDALRAIEKYAGIRPAELNSIRRQEPARGKTTSEKDAITAYRSAVKAASEGDFAGSFEKLDAFGAVVECTETERVEKLVESYLAISAQNESAIVVSQTRAEVADLNERIRDGLRRSGSLTGSEKTLQTLEAVDLTNAQKADPGFHPENAMAIIRRAKGIETGKVIATTAAGIIVEANGELRKVRNADLDRLTICRTNELTVGKGDRLQIKANTPSADGRKLANGEIVTVAKVAANGALTLEDGRIIPATFRQFTRGYVVTSYGSQGKTVEHVLFSDSATRAATNAEQWYVTISRGRKSIRIFTTDKAQLAANIQRTGNRALALDVFNHPARNRVRQHFLHGVKLGREFARRVCMAVATRWAAAAKRAERTSISQ